ncbi:MFS general substrate transporter [Aspergillus uvarum CBS 121591]|uniref:MFS general substrate transporter n=1 Tax=Aspergillus uvarum CBS 121591 TaxID=1448315 RepID=A0A319D6Y5_9EURO|nr:MFS general substrate transporter [Aspergillus uvarum CBS 121591]PYH86683.1 MFS general substrate transporter [Aspergillus uvarum CBS 121591]
MFMSAKTLRLAQRILIIAPAFILYGYNQAGLSALLILSDVIRLFPQIDTVNTHGAQETQNSTIKRLINGTLMLGALLGALSCSVLGDKLSRRKTIFVGGCCAAVGQILQCTAFSLAQSTVGRIILGFGIGQFSVVVPVWQAQSSSAGKRGRQVITSGIFICVGLFLSSWINLGCSKITSPPLQWRIPLAVPVVFSLVICFSIFSLPESPRWLLIRREVSRIDASFSTGPTISLRDVFRKNDPHRLGYRFALCLGIQTLQQLKFLCSFLSFAAVDRLYRRWILVTSGTGMCFCMIAMAVAISFLAANHAASITAAIAPAPLRAVMSFIITMVTPVALSIINRRYYVVFACTCACVPVIVLLFFPETMNRDLELIDELFREAPTIWEVVPMARRLPQRVSPSAQMKKDREKAFEAEGATEEQRMGLRPTSFTRYIS